MKSLDSRLQAAADYVTPGGVAADIGTDHGYLPIWLVKSGRAEAAVAADVNPGPLKAAADNIRAEGLESRIRTVLTDGLDGIPLHEITDIIIAGMGGMLIAEILGRHLPLAGKNLILQPMTQAPFLRSWLSRNGLSILSETPAEVGGKMYTVICAQYTGETAECGSFFAHTGKIPDALKNPEKAEMARKYLFNLQRKLNVILYGMSRSGTEDERAAEYREVSRRIEELIS